MGLIYMDKWYYEWEGDNPPLWFDLPAEEEEFDWTAWGDENLMEMNSEPDLDWRAMEDDTDLDWIEIIE